MGRDRRRPRLPPGPVRARGRAGRRPRRLRQLLDPRGRRHPGADAQGLRVPRRRHRARRPRARSRASPRSRSPTRARRAAGGRSSRRPASTGPPRGRQRDHRGRSSARATRSPRRRATGQTDYLQVVQNWGAQAGARTNHLCLDLYDLPQIPHRVAEELGGAARFVIREGECPYCRLVREEVAPPGPPGLGGRPRSVAFAPYASRSPFEVWVVPRRHEADFGRATDADVARRRRGAAPGARPARGEPRRPALQPRPAHRAAARAGRRDVPLALGDPPAPARDRRPRARDRAAGQPGLARGRGRGAPRAAPSWPRTAPG